MKQNSNQEFFNDSNKPYDEDNSHLLSDKKNADNFYFVSNQG